MQRELERFKQMKFAHNVATEGDGVTASNESMNLQIKPLHDKSELFRAFPFQQKVKNAVGSLIGNPMGLLFDQIFLKPAKSGVGTNWHTDNAYFGIKEKDKGVGMWTALHDATIENGTMEIVPQSHLQEFSHQRDMESDHHITCKPDENKAVHCIVPAGGVVFFNFGIAHCTRRNNSDSERAGAAFHFLNMDAIQADWGWKESQVIPVTGENASDGLVEYGESQRNNWSKIISQTAAR